MSKTAKSKRTKAIDDGASIDPRLMKALSHPLRQRILQALNQRVASPAELSQELDESLGNVSYHVKILAELDAIELVRTAPVRGALEHFYRPIVRPYISGEGWSQLPASIRRELSGQTIQHVFEHLSDATSEDQQDMQASLLELELDDEGFEELNSELATLLDRASEIQKAAAERRASSDDDAEPRRTELALMHFQRAASSKPRAKKKSKAS